jgi:PKHD-type hydroxylase
MKTNKLQDSLFTLYAERAQAFSPDEVARIIEQGMALPQADAIVNNASSEVKYSSRTCKTGWFYPGEDTAWIFNRIVDVIKDINDQHFRFDLNQFEPLQFTSYDSSRQEFYGRHMDCTMGSLHKTATRKLSITIQLSDGIDYQGGDLLLYPGAYATAAPKGLGQLVCFPSFVVHEVTPVTQGTRYSLVTWVHGPLFK